jgi:hypothetical protein
VFGDAMKGSSECIEHTTTNVFTIILWEDGRIST